MILHPLDVPVAYSMLALVNRTVQMQMEPFQQFMCYWAAFNNIYTVLTERDGRTPSLRKDRLGNIKMVSKAGMQMPQVDPVKERDQIGVAFSRFSSDLKRRLVLHPNTKFFVYRIPRWRDQEVQLDARDQRLNGVLNVGYTTSATNPVWSPIDVRAYELYVGNPDDDLASQLAEQILDLIYTVRNNAFHGSKSFNDANDKEVIEKAFPLLKEIVDSFFSLA